MYVGGNVSAADSWKGTLTGVTRAPVTGHGRASGPSRKLENAGGA